MVGRKVYVTMADGNAAGSIVMQVGERVDGDHRHTNGATMAEVMDALAVAGFEPDDPPVVSVEASFEVVDAPEEVEPADDSDPEDSASETVAEDPADTED